MSPSNDKVRTDKPVAWQFKGPGLNHDLFSRTFPTQDQHLWYPVYLGAEPLAEPEERRCSVCRQPESETSTGMLVDIRVITADGEEGFADVTQLLCYEHLAAITKVLISLGFKDHNHGGTDFLEDVSCPGYDDMDACPTPTEYGPVEI